MSLSSSQSKVCFFFPGIKITLHERTRLKDFIGSIFKKEGRKLGALNYIFCKDKDLLKINRQWLKHDFYTDIITFDLSESSEIQGEIYISVDRVKENAQKINVPIKSELLRVIFHGVLHLCGYKDKTKAEKREIREKEDFYLKLY